MTAIKNNKKSENGIVISNEHIDEDVFSMYIRTDVARECLPGQFLSLYCRDASRILPRPISICEIFEDSVRLVYRICGEGTREFSALNPGDEVRFLGPLGNGYPIDKAKGKKAYLIGGGIGIPPLVELAKRLDVPPVVIAGYKSRLFLREELSQVSDFYPATEDGSMGIKGNVLDVLRKLKTEKDVKEPEIIFACGPKPMLKAVQTYAADIPCWISLEERMACGIGACLACICKSRQTDPHFQTNTRRVCKDGPVFNAREVEL